jgi:hypothetical protein
MEVALIPAPVKIYIFSITLLSLSIILFIYL